MLTEEQASADYADAKDRCRRSLVGTRDNARQWQRVKPDEESHVLSELDFEEGATWDDLVLTTPELDFSKGSYKPVPFESAAQLVSVLDEGAAKVRTALKNTPDDAWSQSWKLSFNGSPIFNGTRFVAYREMFLNHLVHHRAQLGVYLRLNEKPVPATYGPSADDRMGF